MSVNSNKPQSAQDIANIEKSKLADIFVTLFEADKKRLYAYIYAYVMSHHAADDIFQETSLTLWREFEKFEIGTHFSKWANGIAFNRIRDYRRANKKYALGLTDDFLSEFDQTLAVDEPLKAELPSKWRHLQTCFELLPVNLKNLYVQFYIDNLKAQDIVEITGRSIFGIRKSIHQLRKKLFDCVEKKHKGEQG